MNLGMPEMIFILLLALVVVGPRRLPELARQLGKYMAEFKRASNEFKQQLESEMLNIELEERAKKTQEEAKVLPPEQPEERIMRPVNETVGRTRAALAGAITAEPEPVTTAANAATPTEQSSSPAVSSPAEQQCPVP